MNAKGPKRDVQDCADNYRRAFDKNGITGTMRLKAARAEWKHLIRRYPAWADYQEEWFAGVVEKVAKPA